MPPAVAPSAPKSVLDDYRWNSHVLILFTPSADYAPFVEQKVLLDAYATGLSDRRTTVIEVIGADLAAADGIDLPPGTGALLRGRFGPPADGLTVLLVGINGLEQSRTMEPTAPSPLFDTLDSHTTHAPNLRTRRR